jgi:hypothetical protein
MKNDSINDLKYWNCLGKYFLFLGWILACPLQVKMGGFFIHERMNAMTNAIKYAGLCETCDHDSTCTLRRMPHLEVIQCEEFSVQSYPSKTLAASPESPFVDPAEFSRMGLCSNCLNVAACGLPQTLQGVQHCEEYVLDEAGIVPPVQPQNSESAA